MKPYTVAIVVAVLSIAPFALGCAEEDAEMPPPAAPIGYTPPPPALASAPAPAPPSSLAPAPAPAVGVADETPVEPADADDSYSDTDPSALSDFRSTLEPYGSWTDDPTYGTVWVPSPSVVGSDFTPYVSAGHWAYDDDYVWVSDYDWGWAPFHYGRWVYGGPVGWEWIPGRAYAGAWVSWRYGWDDWGYVGWAPLPPTWCWRRGVAVGLGFVPVAPYGFVATGNLFAPGVGSRLVVGAQVGVIGAHTRPWVPASPSVGGRVVARPGVGGPPPSALNLSTSAVVRAPVSDRGLMQARSFARPGTAVALGAHPVQGQVARAAAPSSFAAARSVRTLGASEGASQSHFGGRLLGRGFSGSASVATPMRAPEYARAAPAERPYFGAPRTSSAPSYGTSPAFHGSYTASPAFHGAPSGGAAYHASPSFGGGGFHGGGGGGGFHV
ncbi:MAG TPA: DUF6600 domain-containing protein, partial [Polyangiaceae bacterium]|nr:DUF6600 domain-containing protein [Polyangiaceae bacterium]